MASGPGTQTNLRPSCTGQPRCCRAPGTGAARSGRRDHAWRPASGRQCSPLEQGGKPLHCQWALVLPVLSCSWDLGKHFFAFLSCLGSCSFL